MKKWLLAALLICAGLPAHAQSGGTTFQFPASPWSGFAPGIVECGRLLNANFNTTADQPIVMSFPSAGYDIDSIAISSPSVSMTTAQGGFYSGAGKTGVAVVSSTQAYTSLTTNAVNTTGNFMNPTLSTAGATTAFNVTTIYFSLTTAQGAPATANIRVYCDAHY